MLQIFFLILRHVNVISTLIPLSFALEILHEHIFTILANCHWKDHKLFATKNKSPYAAVQYFIGFGGLMLRTIAMMQLSLITFCCD